MMNSPAAAEFQGKRIAVIGLAATGLATARVLRDCGAIVTVYDGKAEEKLDAARVAEVQSMEGVRFEAGNNEADWTATDLIVPSPGVPRYAPVLTGAVKRGIPVLGEIEVAYRLAQAPIMAITGTNGKTTTTALVGAICREAGLETWVAGNIAEDAGKRLPLIQAAIEAPASGVIIAEISSFQLEWVERFRPKIAAWLNLAPDHMDRHRDMEEYGQAKTNIFRAQTRGDFAILNADDESVMRFSEGVGRGRRLPFSLRIHPQAFIFNDGEYILQWTDFGKPELGAQVWLRNDEVPIPGQHNVANVMAALAMTTAFGIEALDAMKATLEFKGVAHRMELVGEVYGVQYINNSMCTNPAAVKASAEASPKPLIAISGGFHKGGDLSGMAESLARNAKRVILIGQATAELADVLKMQGFYNFEAADSLPDAVHRATKTAEAGDTVMLIPGCASFDMFSGFEERGQVFRDAVREMTIA